MRIDSKNKLALFVCILLLASCGKPAHEKSERFVFVATNVGLPYWQDAKAGFLGAAKMLGVQADFEGPNTYAPDQELKTFQDAVASQPSGIVVSPGQAKLFTEAINQAIAAGVPVIAVDSDAPDSKRILFIGTDNYRAGLQSGKLLASLMHEHGRVAVLTINGQNNLDERMRGVQDAWKPYPYMSFYKVADDHGDAETARSEIAAMLQNKEPVEAILCLEASGGPGAAKAVAQFEMSGKITIVAMDANRETLEGILKGVIAATVAQKPYTMGFYGLQLLDDLHHNRVHEFKDWRTAPTSPLPEMIDTGTVVVDGKNVDEFRNALASHTE
ncbi:MAG TPA: substrate-binding domain-containing protein [Terriglobia bacterium]|nr:substrate-binding domain-containing protein [Terriglobia bacterium]